MIVYDCDHCGKKLRAPDTSAGKKARCPDCQRPSLVPATVALSPDATKTEKDRDPHATLTRSGQVPAPGAAAPPSVNIPGYEVLGELGRGGMGVVYRARQLRPRRVVALKMVLAGDHASADALARFRAEAEAVARLSHPGIVAVHEVGEHHGRPYFSLEFVEGGSLAGLLDQEKLSPRESAELVHDLARAVEFAHKRGIIHRDLKPANVLLAQRESDGDEDEDGGGGPRLRWRPKVTDFGLSKQLDDMASVAPAGPRTASGAVMGTPAYMAPEQAAGKKDVGPAADVYALGAILYECLTGRPPFEGASMIDTLMKVSTEDPKSPRGLNPKVPRDLETVCLKCLRKAPAERYATAKALAEDLRRFLDGKPVKARPLGALARAGRWLSRNKLLTYSVGGMLAASAVVVVSFLLLFGGGQEPKGPAGGGSSVATAGGGQMGQGDGLQPAPAGQLVDRTVAARSSSSNNLKMIGIALHTLHDIQGRFPTAAIRDPVTGQALLSWRVAILPYIEQDALHRQFRLNERWDSAHNKALIAQMPKTYELPRAGAPAGHTYYQVFTGPDTLFDPAQRTGRTIGSITDGTSNTIMVVEAGRAVPWTKPEDIEYDPRKPIPALGGPFTDPFMAGLADGSVREVSRTVSDRTLRSFITASDGIAPGDDWPGGTGTTGRKGTKPMGPGGPPGGPPGRPASGPGGAGSPPRRGE